MLCQNASKFDSIWPMRLSQLLQDIYDLLLPFEQLWQTEPLEQYPIHATDLNEYLRELNDLDLNQLVQLEDAWEVPSKRAPRISKVLESAKKIKNAIPQHPLDEQSLHNNDNHLYRKMPFKKVHEIKTLIPIIKEVHQAQHIFDFGGGVGHLAQSLAMFCDKKITTFDRDKTLLESGKERIEKYFPELTDKVHFEYADIQDIQLKTKPRGDEMLIGLHSCGPLSVKLIEYALNHRLSLCSYGCCYHKMKNEFNLSSKAKELNLNFSNHALMLAARSNTHLTMDDYQVRRHLKQLRYSLHLYLYHCLNKRDFIGFKKDKVNTQGKNFHTYAFEQLEKINIEFSLTQKQANDFVKEHESTVEDMIRLGNFRAVFGQLIELYLIVDRGLFLVEQGYFVEISRTFDRKLSPRHLQLLATI